MDHSPKAIDDAMRVHSLAVREQLTQKNNDRRQAAGLPPTHCGVVAVTNEGGDLLCRKCGEVGW